MTPSFEKHPWSRQAMPPVAALPLKDHTCCVGTAFSLLIVFTGRGLWHPQHAVNLLPPPLLSDSLGTSTRLPSCYFSLCLAAFRWFLMQALTQKGSTYHAAAYRQLFPGTCSLILPALLLGSQDRHLLTALADLLQPSHAFHASKNEHSLASVCLFICIRVLKEEGKKVQCTPEKCSKCALVRHFPDLLSILSASITQKMHTVSLFTDIVPSHHLDTWSPLASLKCGTVVQPWRTILLTIMCFFWNAFLLSLFSWRSLAKLWITLTLPFPSSSAEMLWSAIH